MRLQLQHPHHPNTKQQTPPRLQRLPKEDRPTKRSTNRQRLRVLRLPRTTPPSYQSEETSRKRQYLPRLLYTKEPHRPHRTQTNRQPIHPHKRRHQNHTNTILTNKKNHTPNKTIMSHLLKKRQKSTHPRPTPRLFKTKLPLPTILPQGWTSPNKMQHRLPTKPQHQQHFHSNSTLLQPPTLTITTRQYHPKYLPKLPRSRRQTNTNPSTRNTKRQKHRDPTNTKYSKHQHLYQKHDPHNRNQRYQDYDPTNQHETRGTHHYTPGRRM